MATVLTVSMLTLLHRTVEKQREVSLSFSPYLALMSSLVCVYVSMVGAADTTGLVVFCSIRLQP